MKKYPQDFKNYLSIHFPEHAKRILKSQSSAWFCRIFYPMAFFLVPAVFFAVAAFFVYCLKQPQFTGLQEHTQVLSSLQNISLKRSLFGILALGGFVTLGCFFIGLMIGFSRAHTILFEAEKLELKTKKLWLMEKEKEWEKKEIIYKPTPAKKRETDFQEPEV